MPKLLPSRLSSFPGILVAVADGDEAEVGVILFGNVCKEDPNLKIQRQTFGRHAYLAEGSPGVNVPSVLFVAGVSHVDF